MSSPTRSPLASRVPRAAPRFDPKLQPGAPIFVRKKDTTNEPCMGTLTCFVKDQNGKLYILTCGHTASDADDKFLYGSSDFAVAPVAVLTENRFEARKEGCLQDDMALYEVRNPHELKAANFCILGSPGKELIGAKEMAQPGEAALMVGAKTFLDTNKTSMEVQTAELKSSHERFGIANRAAANAAEKQFQCTKGDSGAPVFTETCQLMGMYHMGDSQGATAGTSGKVIKIGHILRSLDVEVASSADIPVLAASAALSGNADDLPEDPFGGGNFATSAAFVEKDTDGD